MAKQPDNNTFKPSQIQKQDEYLLDEEKDNLFKPEEATEEVKKDEKPDDKGELICVMNIELDGGKTMTFIEIYDQDEPKQVVSQFGEKYNLSNNAQSRLLEQVLS